MSKIFKKKNKWCLNIKLYHTAVILWGLVENNVLKHDV